MENFKNFNFLWVVDVGDKKIHDGCKDCMSLYGRCNEAEKLFNDKYVLSPFLPFSGSREASDWRYMEKPLNFPLKCFHNDRYHHCGFTVYGCEHCDITYEAIDAPMYDYYGEDCPICGSSPEFLAQKNLYYNKYYLITKLFFIMIPASTTSATDNLRLPDRTRTCMHFCGGF